MAHDAVGIVHGLALRLRPGMTRECQPDDQNRDQLLHVVSPACLASSTRPVLGEQIGRRSAAISHETASSVARSHGSVSMK